MDLKKLNRYLTESILLLEGKLIGARGGLFTGGFAKINA